MRKTVNNNLINKLKILEKCKPLVIKNGWSIKIYEELLNDKEIGNNVVISFPDGYKSILFFSLEELNIKIKNELNKINLISLPTGKRIKKILITRLKFLDNDKQFYRKTFNHLLLPTNSKIMKKNLYKTIDDMWFLAGDNSTDFNFYTKRIILAIIYINSLFILYNKNLDEAETNIDKNLKKISKIPKLKDRFSFIKDNLPFFLKGIFS